MPPVLRRRTARETLRLGGRAADSVRDPDGGISIAPYESSHVIRHAGFRADADIQGIRFRPRAQDATRGPRPACVEALRCR